MRSKDLRACPRRPFRPKTTQPRITRRILRPICYRKPGFLQTPGAQLVSDITYIPTREGWLYLAVVIDLFSRAILGWKLSDSLHADLVVGATTRAIESGLVPQGAIFHSDRGCQYSATITRELLARHGLRQSMSAKGYCYIVMTTLFLKAPLLPLSLKSSATASPSTPNAPPPLRFSITSRPSTTEGASIAPSVIFPPTLSSIVIFKTKIPI